MNLLISPYEFSPSNIFFLDKKENTIMKGSFIKFIYSTELITLNGLFLDFSILETEQTIYNGKQYLFFPIENPEVNEYINIFERIESEILDLFIKIQVSKNNREILNKTKINTIYKQLKNMCKTLKDLFINQTDSIYIRDCYF